MQIDDQVGSGQQLAKIVVIPVVGVQFLIVEIEAGEDLVFFEDEIRNDQFLGLRSRIQVAQLLETVDQERELRLKRGARLTVVKSAKKRIMFRIGHALRIQAFGEN